MTSTGTMQIKPDYFEPGNPECGFFKIEGWVVDSMFHVLGFTKQMMRDNGIPEGGSFEIGVHHGRFFLMLEQMTQAGEPCVAIDVFGLQQFNIDSSGSGSRAIFEGYVAEFAKDPDRIKILELDSTDLARAPLHPAIPPVPYTMISVDGCHTAKHTYLDLATAARYIAPGGVCILDDVGNLSWIDVLAGAVDYLRDPSSTLAPFACGFNKMLFTTIGYQKIYFDYFYSRHSEIPAIPGFQWPRTPTFCGYSVFQYGV